MGLMASSERSAQAASWSADQRPHRRSSVTTSRRTLLSTRTSVRSATGQGQDLVRGHRRGGLPPHPRHQRAAPAASLGGLADLHRLPDHLELHLRVREQSQAPAYVLRDGDLALRRDTHGGSLLREEYDNSYSDRSLPMEAMTMAPRSC